MNYSENDSSSNNGYYGTPYGVPAAEYGRRPAGKKRNARLRTAALVLCCSMLSGVAGAAAVRGFDGAKGEVTLQQSSRAPQTVQVSYVNGQDEMTAAEVYAANVRSTVGVTTSVTTNYWGFKTSSAASGSGFIISSDGYIVTNYHVIEDSDSITVTDYDGKTYPAVPVGCDESNDLAVLKIDADGLTPVVLGDSDTLNVGDDVVAIGNPLGELTFSLTKGGVSALNREVTLSSNVTMNLIQTDAAINAGNSGGALFNLYGEVVGITNAKYSSGMSSEASVDNIGFAIPINSVRQLITSIIEKGYVSKPYLGVSLKDAADAALICGVEKDSPAEEAGLQANDIVTKAGDTAISSASDLTALVKTLSAGDSLTLTVLRGGAQTEITVTVGEKRQSALPETEESAEPQWGTPAFGGFPFGFFGGGSDFYGRG